jgi:hypothetical protein
MKNGASLIIVALLATIFAGCSRHPLTAPTSPQPVSFSGYTNGVVGAIAPVVATMTTNYAAVIQRWLADGTNGAVFTITNQQTCDIWIYPLGRIINAGGHAAYDETPLLNAPTFSGICLMPRQVATLEVAVFPHEAPWRMSFMYTRTDQHIGLLESLRARITREPIHLHSYFIESDMIDK